MYKINPIFRSLLTQTAEESIPVIQRFPSKHWHCSRFSKILVGTNISTHLQKKSIYLHWKQKHFKKACEKASFRLMVGKGQRRGSEILETYNIVLLSYFEKVILKDENVNAYICGEKNKQFRKIKFGFSVNSQSQNKKWKT